MKKNKDGHIQASPMPRKLKSFVNSSAIRDQTRYLKPLDLNYKNIKGEHVRIKLVETPAWNTQINEVDMAYSIGLLKAITKANSVRLVFIIQQINMVNRAEEMKSHLYFFYGMIKYSNIDSMNFFFTNFSDLN
jgi:hypothetical protein